MRRTAYQLPVENAAIAGENGRAGLGYRVF
jgi:hypothetical protein